MFIMGTLLGTSTYSLKGSFGEPAAGSTSPSASTRPREFVLGGTLGRRLLILGLRFGALEVHFDVFLWPWGQTLDPFFGFSQNLPKKILTKTEKGAEMDAFPVIFKVFPESAKVRFDCAGASGLRFGPLLFWLCASIFRHFFCHRILLFFGHPWDLQKVRSASEPAPP